MSDDVEVQRKKKKLNSDKTGLEFSVGILIPAVRLTDLFTNCHGQTDRLNLKHPGESMPLRCEHGKWLEGSAASLNVSHPSSS